MAIHEALTSARYYLDNQDPIQLNAIALARRALDKAGVIDPMVVKEVACGQPIYRHPCFVFYPEKRLVETGGKSTGLLYLENKILILFMESPNKVITFETISSKIWNRKCDKFVKSRTRPYISRLRNILGDRKTNDGKFGIIKNFSKIGYELIDPSRNGYGKIDSGNGAKTIEEALDAVRRHPDNQTQPKQKAITLAEGFLITGGVADPTKESNIPPAYRHPRFIYYPDENRIEVDGESIYLSIKENLLLDLFTESPNQMIADDEISERLYPGEKWDKYLQRSIATCVSRLRKKLGDKRNGHGKHEIIIRDTPLSYRLVDSSRL